MRTVFHPRSPFIAAWQGRGKYTRILTASPSFPLEFGIRRGHVAAVEGVEGGPVLRLGKADLLRGLLDCFFAPDRGPRFLEDHREITPLRVESLWPACLRASVPGNVVRRIDLAQIVHHPKK